MRKKVLISFLSLTFLTLLTPSVGAKELSFCAEVESVNLEISSLQVKPLEHPFPWWNVNFPTEIEVGEDTKITFDFQYGIELSDIKPGYEIQVFCDENGHARNINCKPGASKKLRGYIFDVDPAGGKLTLADISRDPAKYKTVNIAKFNIIENTSIIKHEKKGETSLTPEELQKMVEEFRDKKQSIKITILYDRTNSDVWSIDL